MVLEKISGGPLNHPLHLARGQVADTHSKVRAILRRIFNSGALCARLLIEKTCTRHNLKERVC